MHIIYKEKNSLKYRLQKTHATTVIYFAGTQYFCIYIKNVLLFIRLVAKRSAPARDSSLSRALTPIYEPS